LTSTDEIARLEPAWAGLAENPKNPAKSGIKNKNRKSLVFLFLFFTLLNCSPVSTSLRRGI
jgi:hypothetical protein